MLTEWHRVAKVCDLFQARLSMGEHARPMFVPRSGWGSSPRGDSTLTETVALTATWLYSLTVAPH